MPDGFSYQRTLFPGALGNWRWEQGTGRGSLLAQGLLTWAHTLFLKFVFSAGGTVTAPAPSVQQRAVPFEIWRQIFKEVVGRGGGGRKLNNSLEPDSACFLSILKYELCKHAPHSTCSSICQKSHKSPLLLYTLLFRLPSSQQALLHHLAVPLPTQSPQTHAPFCSCCSCTFPTSTCT